MATWDEIVSSKDEVETIFGSDDLTQLKMEDKMDLMMVAMLKMHKDMATNKVWMYKEIMTNDDNLESNLLTSSLLKI